MNEHKLKCLMQELFKQSRKSLGSRRMSRLLRYHGYDVGRHKARRLMREIGLKVKIKKKFRLTTDSKHSYPIADNILNREFNPAAVNQAWGADITYVWTNEGWLYLAVVIDLFSRRVVGWCIDKTMTQSLVIRALMMAINLRKPPSGLIHHSDRGSQYASHAYRELHVKHGIVVSMSRKGNCWDNSPVERFFSSLKREWLAGRNYQTRESAIHDIREYVAVYYNSKRLHSTLNYMTPLDFEKCA